MTYNIRYDNPNDGVNAWPNRKQKVFNLIKKHNPDIIGVQEALHHQLEDIIKNLPEYTYTGVGRDDGKEKGEYSAILYKKEEFDLKDKNTFWLSETPDVPGSKSWDAAITRVATWGKFFSKKLNTEILIVNTHFDHIGKEARKNSAVLIKEKMTTLAGTMPTILMGDFNCTREEPPYKALMEQPGLTIHDPAPSSPPGTFCDFPVGKIICNPIDYIFTTAHWRNLGYDVIQDNDGKHYPSDHLPVMILSRLK